MVEPGSSFGQTREIIENQMRLAAKPIKEAIGSLAVSMLDRLPPNIKIEYLPRDDEDNEGHYIYHMAADPFPVVIYHPRDNKLTFDLVLFNKDDLAHPIDLGIIAYAPIPMEIPLVIQSREADLIDWVKYGSRIVERLEEAAAKFHTGQLYYP